MKMARGFWALGTCLFLLVPTASAVERIDGDLTVSGTVSAHRVLTTDGLVAEKELEAE